MKISGLRRPSFPKVAVLVTGLTAAILAATITPMPAQAFPSRTQDCTACHGAGTVSGTVTALPSTTTPAANAPYTVAVKAPDNADQPGGATGYRISWSGAAGETDPKTVIVTGGGTGSLLSTYTANMKAPAQAGTYSYKVWAVKGLNNATGVANFDVYSITVPPTAPTADFTTSVAYGATPLLVSLTNASTGDDPKTYLWTFDGGNPATSTDPSPSVTFAALGNHAVTLVATNVTGVSARTKTITVTAPVPAAVTTSTALALSSTTSVAPGSATLTATVTGARVAGAVEFFDGATSLGTIPVFAGGATKVLSSLAAATYSYTAKFIPTSADAFTPSASSNVPFVVTVPVAVKTTTALAVTPASPVDAPASPTLTATVTGAGASGTVQFLNGTTVVGTSTVAAGRATLALTGVAAGNYSYTANFIPTNVADFTASTTSSAVAFVVTVPAAATTSTALALSSTTSVAPGAATLTATVTGAGAAGAVEFFDGTTSLGTIPVFAGGATKVLSSLAAATYSYTAKFIPTSAADFTASTSSAKAYVVTAPVPTVVTTTTALAVAPASPVVAPASPTLTATVSGAGAAGTVEFFNGATSLGTSPVASGLAAKALSGVVAGSYSYSAKFIPSSAAAFGTSTSSNVTFVVTAPTVVGTPSTEVERYIVHVYSDLFKRVPDPAGLAAWTHKLNTPGTPRIAVANGITYSNEYRSTLIKDSYTTFLHRSPDAAGLKSWLAAMGRGMTIARMESGFIASPEYFAKAGSTNAGLVTKLYLDVLGRAASPTEVANWKSQLDKRHLGRSQVAMGFLLSSERLRTVVNGYYQTLLGRSIDPSGQRTWVGILQRGGRDEAIIGGIVASAEYFAKS